MHDIYVRFVVRTDKSNVDSVKNAESFVSSYVKMKYPQATLSVHVLNEEWIARSVHSLPSVSVSVTPDDKNVQSDIVVFLSQLMEQVFDVPFFEKKPISIRGFIKVPQFLDCASFYDAWMYAVSHLPLYKVDVGPVVFIPYDGHYFYQIITVDNCPNYLEKNVIASVKGVGYGVFFAQRNKSYVSSN